MRSARFRSALIPIAGALATFGIISAGIMSNGKKCEEGIEVRTTSISKQNNTEHFKATISECYKEGFRENDFAIEKKIEVEQSGLYALIKRKGKIKLVKSREKNAHKYPTISEEGLMKKIDNKKIVLFADDHAETKDDERFTSIIKKMKVTHIGLEFSEHAQDELEIFLKTPTLDNSSILSNAILENADVKNGYIFIDLIEKIEKLKNFKIFFFDTPISMDSLYSETREVHMERTVSAVVENGARVALFIGFIHASTAPKIVNIENGRKIAAPKSLARRLKEKYRDNAVTVDLRGCYSAYIDYCIE